MKEITGYIYEYARQINKSVLVTTTLFTALLIFLNYRYGIDDKIENSGSAYSAFYYRYLQFLLAFFVPYLFGHLITGKPLFKNAGFLALLLISPALFSLKMAMNTDISFSGSASNNFLINQLVYWPLRLTGLVAVLLLIWRLFYKDDSFFGLTTRQFKWKPYFFMLLFMIPLVTVASTQPDFLETYPKLNLIENAINDDKSQWLKRLLFELSYGSDFISVELFFRGFLVLGFTRFAGKDAILPMACYYCTIHFGKPLGECISSYFGGILLGIIVVNTRSIIGGLMVHLGIAWLMELGGFLGNYYK